MSDISTKNHLHDLIKEKNHNNISFFPLQLETQLHDHMSDET
uniref:Uncharacterized protein n=1 Tax=Arundo donax TaxID=35708 RepID=A0A0A9GX20_ARUDO